METGISVCPSRCRRQHGLCGRTSSRPDAESTAVGVVKASSHELGIGAISLLLKSRCVPRHRSLSSGVVTLPDSELR